MSACDDEQIRKGAEQRARCVLADAIERELWEHRQWLEHRTTSPVLSGSYEDFAFAEDPAIDQKRLADRDMGIMWEFANEFFDEAEHFRKEVWGMRFEEAEHVLEDSIQRLRTGEHLDERLTRAFEKYCVRPALRKSPFSRLGAFVGLLARRVRK